MKNLWHETLERDGRKFDWCVIALLQWPHVESFDDSVRQGYAVSTSAQGCGPDAFVGPHTDSRLISFIPRYHETGLASGTQTFGRKTGISYPWSRWQP